MRRKIYEIIGRVLLYGCAAITAGLLLFLIGYILFRGIGGINWRFLSTAESVINGTVGILPAIKNTVFVIIVSLIVALPGRWCGGLSHRICPEPALCNGD